MSMEVRLRRPKSVVKRMFYIVDGDTGRGKEEEKE